MSAGKHTPGPWFTFANGACVGGPVGILGNPSGADTAGVAHCGMALRTGDELQANARLIAAAPELLDALQDALSIFHPEPGEEHLAPKWSARASAAIAKATGSAA